MSKYSMSKLMYNNLYKLFKKKDSKNTKKAILDYVNTNFGVKNGVSEIIVGN